MINTDQFLAAAFRELSYVRPGQPAATDELAALRAARDCNDELMRARVTELRADPLGGQTWPAIAYALGSPSVSAARDQFALEPSAVALPTTTIEEF